jgi:hypothetical protein
MSFQADTGGHRRHHIVLFAARRRFRSFFASLGLLGGLALAPGEALAEAAEPTAAGSFWQDWGDGKAEVDGYALKLMRYGQPRTGSLVLIYVTEPLSDSLRVKADPG